uniref:XIAP-associated factor 1 n=1 Tax=Rhizophora mucronata TaxID=61149 RepID=A0A2P2KYC8_RHIMU
MDREILAIHKGENCPQRIVTCEFCEFPLPAVDLAEHQEVCGNRTELCHMCNRYIRLRERYNHETRCTGMVDNSVGSSRYNFVHTGLDMLLSFSLPLLFV